MVHATTLPRSCGTTRAKTPACSCSRTRGIEAKGYSVRNGVLAARGDLILFTDADLSSPIEEAPKLFAALQQGRGYGDRITVAAGGIAE